MRIGSFPCVSRVAVDSGYHISYTLLAAEDGPVGRRRLFEVLSQRHGLARDDGRVLGMGRKHTLRAAVGTVTLSVRYAGESHGVCKLCPPVHGLPRCAR